MTAGKIISYHDQGEIRSGSLEELHQAFGVGAKMKVGIRGLHHGLGYKAHGSVDMKMLLI